MSDFHTTIRSLQDSWDHYVARWFPLKEDEESMSKDVDLPAHIILGLHRQVAEFHILGESFVWNCQAIPKRTWFTAGAIGLIVGLLALLVFGLIMGIGGGIAFMLIALYAVLCWARARNASWLVATDRRRIVIVRPAWLPIVTMQLCGFQHIKLSHYVLDNDTMLDVNLYSSNDGSGTVIARYGEPPLAPGERSRGPYKEVIRFTHCPHVMGVKEALFGDAESASSVPAPAPLILMEVQSPKPSVQFAPGTLEFDTDGDSASQASSSLIEGIEGEFEQDTERKPGEEELTADNLECVKWIRSRISLSTYNEEQWKDEYSRSVVDFLTGDAMRRLFIFEDGVVGLCVQFSLPADAGTDFMYFVRTSGSFVSYKTIADSVQYGLVAGSALDSLHRLMNSVYMPLFMEGSAFTDLYKKEFTGQFHKFMASLTETAHRARGTTVLYVPTENVQNAEEAARDKNLVQRLESALIHWTRQIKEVIGHHDHSEQAENVGPLFEIHFWKSRTEDLSGIRDQLNQDGVALIVAVLEVAKSSYLAPFYKLSEMIEAGSIEAQDNIKFLNPLLPSCTQLANAEPKDIPPILPSILDTIRMIWSLSRFYNTSERMTGLLRKVSNEVINRCVHHISLDDIFHGDVMSSMAVLKDSVEAGEAWKAFYEQTSQNIAARSGSANWDFDESSVFAQVDAFVMRCRDLMEVCEAQIQFARRIVGGKKAPVPVFGGSRGQDTSRALADIDTSFERLLNGLANVGYSILDVKTTKWHDDYNTFKQGIKDLEVMLRNVITSVFENVATVSDGILVLTIFHNLAVRDSIKRMVEKKTTEVLSVFMHDLNTVRSDFDLYKRHPPYQRSHPPFAGAVFWARSLLQRIDSQAARLENAGIIIPAPEYEGTRIAYDRLHAGLQSYIDATFTEWSVAFEGGEGSNLLLYLENPLLANDGSGFLLCNFHKNLLHAFAELDLWQKMGFEIPATPIMAEVENLRILRENTLILVTDYNSILNTLSPSERRLFQERINHLQEVIQPGFTDLTWKCDDRDKILDFIERSRAECKIVAEFIQDFKSTVAYVEEIWLRIRDMLLVDLEKKKVYSREEFEERQEAYRQIALKRVQEGHEEILNALRKSFEVFKDAGTDVRREWALLIQSFDKSLEESLRQTVKKSIQRIDRAINGDSRTEAQPLFTVRLVLESPATKAAFMNKPQMFFRPSMDEMIHMVTSVCSEVVSSISSIPRLLEALEEEMEFEVHLEPDATRQGHEYPPINYHQVIRNDDDVLKIILNITNGMNGLRERLLKYIEIWGTSYKEVWDIDKDAFIRRYMRTHAETDMYLNIDADINRYRIQQQLIQNEETSTVIQYIQIDCSPLKNSLIQHCTEWMNKFTTLLNQVANKELHELHDLFSSNTAKLRQPPASLWHMGESLDLVRSLTEKKEAIEARFEPLATHYRTLEKWEVSITEEEASLLVQLPSKWEEFQQMLVDAQRMLESYKERFKAELLMSQESFVKGTQALREEFRINAPYESVVSVERALDIIQGFKEEIREWREKEADVRKGLQIFGLDLPVVKEIPATIKELELLERIWMLTSNWSDLWEKWKHSQFLGLDSQELEGTAASFLKRVGRMREIKSWDVWTALKDRIDQFRRTLPLIQELKNRALRDRHWEVLQEEIGKSFDPHAGTFTLEFVLDLGLDQFSEVIVALSSSATQELAIEESLNGLQVVWSATDLDIAVYKEDYHKLRSADEIFQLLDDHQVTLSAMKNSQYYQAFESQVEMWEKTLSRILETVEMMLLVQRSWMYLENIFIGSADIRRQLPAESALFDSVNSTWKFVMNDVAKERNVLKSTGAQGLQDMLSDLNTKLERIQKSLDQYLETKRRSFPRFYFISNDDLLEILGQARDPNAVQPHLKKCFENIKSLALMPPGTDGRRSWEAIDMISSEGESVRFNSPVAVDGPAEVWLGRIVHNMQSTLHRQLIECLADHKKLSRSKLIKEWPGQLLITAGQIIWTMETTKALTDTEKGDRNALKVLRKQQNILLSRLAALVQGQLSNLQRLKINALLTIEVHARDVIERLIHGKCSSASTFDWLSQLRFYYDKDRDRCLIRQTNTECEYGYEYLGNTGRLVVTPLTDRCYMTLTMAMHLKLGSAPQGPAGTGKTETVKDLGKGLAKFVLVMNCSEGLDFKSLGRMFSGLAQTGSWSCFDEFNRIDIEVLSVVAQQIQCILNAIINNSPRFVFEGAEIPLNPACGFFVTMNPGYAGRTELPDNLKSLFRPVSMMVPDAALIAEIMLFSEGFPVAKAKALSKKVVTLYELSIQQLSKQDHYDFGLRAIKSVLVAAGELRRAEPEWTEELMLLKSMRDMNVPKLVAEDLDLFLAIMGDLFPGADAPVSETSLLQQAIEADMVEHGLQLHPILVEKIIQLDLTKATRHGVMLVGAPGSGKTTAWKTLQRAYARLKRAGHEGFQNVRSYVLNPKALTLGELFGDYDQSTREWVDGVLSAIVRTVCADEREDLKWIVMDGPVDTTWIESMNTVLDDNKMLTLVNSERISLSNTVSLLFEVSDLSEASPATISRVGMVYLDTQDLGWKPYVLSWLARHEDKVLVEHLEKLVARCVQSMLDFKRENCTEPVPITDLNAVTTLCRLFDVLATPENGCNPADADFYGRMIELWFIFCLIWSIGSAMDEAGRIKVDGFLREIEGQFPTTDTVYEYYVDSKKREWTHWSEKLPQQWRYPADTPFHKILVPTVDTVRTSYLVQALVRSNHHVLLTGTTGVGKTTIIQNILTSVSDQFANLTLNFSSRTTSDRTQRIIDAALEKRTKDVYVPQGGRKLIVFVDDLNMPAKDRYGSQPPLELLRQWIDHGFWYDKQHQSPKHIQGMQLVAGMGHPGGGREVISTRLQSRFSLVNMTFPDRAQIIRIYETMITQKLNDFEEEIKPLAPSIVKSTVDLYQIVVKEMLPTPHHSHYSFNLRDLSKVFQGIMCTNRNYYDVRESVIRLWIHECLRVFHDRLIDDDDRGWLIKQLQEKLSTHFNMSWGQLFGDNDTHPVFGAFMREGGDDVYEEIADVEGLRTLMDEKLEDYNLEPKKIPMDLVLFKDAIGHICRIHRIIHLPRGNALLIGVGGSGRQSLTRLAAHMAGYEVFQIEPRRNYRLNEFHEDLKALYQQTGVEKIPTVFLFTDTQILEEGFLEDIGNILSSGEVPNLYVPEELAQIRDAVREDAKAAGVPENANTLFNFFIERVRANLHVVLCMSPVGGGG